LEAIKAAMRIKDLWIPSNDWVEENDSEGWALATMESKFKAILTKRKGE